MPTTQHRGLISQVGDKLVNHESQQNRPQYTCTKLYTSMNS